MAAGRPRRGPDESCAIGDPHPDPATAAWPEADHDSRRSCVEPKPRRDDTLIKALVRAHRWRPRSRSGRRSRSPTLRSRRASGRLRLPASAAHLPRAGHTRKDFRQRAAKGMGLLICYPVSAPEPAGAAIGPQEVDGPRAVAEMLPNAPRRCHWGGRARRKADPMIGRAPPKFHLQAKTAL